MSNVLIKEEVVIENSDVVLKPSTEIKEEEKKD